MFSFFHLVFYCALLSFYSLGFVDLFFETCQKHGIRSLSRSFVCVCVCVSFFLICHECVNQSFLYQLPFILVFLLASRVSEWFYALTVTFVYYLSCFIYVLFVTDLFLPIFSLYVISLFVDFVPLFVISFGFSNYVYDIFGQS